MRGYLMGQMRVHVKECVAKLQWLIVTRSVISRLSQGSSFASLLKVRDLMCVFLNRVQSQLFQIFVVLVCVYFYTFIYLNQFGIYLFQVNFYFFFRSAYIP